MELTTEECLLYRHVVTRLLVGVNPLKGREVPLKNNGSTGDCLAELQYNLIMNFSTILTICSFGFISI